MFVCVDTGSLVWTLAKGPLEVVAGLVYGAVFGVVCWALPHQESKNRPAFKFIILFCLGALGMFGSHKVRKKRERERERERENVINFT